MESNNRIQYSKPEVRPLKMQKLSRQFPNFTSDFDGSVHFDGTWLMTGFFVIFFFIIVGMIYLFYRLLMEENVDEDENGANELAEEVVIRRDGVHEPLTLKTNV